MVENIIRYDRTADESYSEYAYRVLRDRIMKFELIPGAPLNENELAEDLQVSRTPVHEALAKLRDEKLVDIQPRKESRVSKIDLVLVNDGIFIRSCVEPELIQTIQGNLSTPIMQRMLRNINCQRQILLEGNPDNEFNGVDDEFHMLLYMAANRENTFIQVHKMIAHFDRIRYLARSIGNFDDVDTQCYEEHREIFGAVAYRAELSTDARTLIRRHITRFQTRMYEIMERYGDYFVNI
ncbi:MAG: GntR family transcriptional regulator [Clostridia bacterium]|nr:GntR family transcriptional regulator [Clostridia bacterium]